MLGGGMGVGFGWMELFWLLIIVGVGLLIVVAARVVGGEVSRGAATSAAGRGRARELLEERYAEYRERLCILGEDA